MVTLFPRRYSEPKWQIKITESEKHFHFQSGWTVTTPYELKLALTDAPESDIHQAVSGKEHHIASWLEFVVGDPELAQAVKQYTHRWGMLVALERQQMRTLNLPAHVASYWLRKVQYSFTFVGGESVDTLKKLAPTLEKVTDDTIDFHLQRQPNDISTWLLNVVGDYELAEILEESSNRTQMQGFVADHLEKLQDASQ